MPWLVMAALLGLAIMAAGWLGWVAVVGCCRAWPCAGAALNCGTRMDLPPAMNAVVLPHWVVSAVVHCPGGAYPSYAHGCYERDNAFYQRWDAIARDRAAFQAWMHEHVLELADHGAFLARLKAKAA